MSDIKQKVQNSLIFHQSDLWESIMWIIDEAEKNETSLAISQSQDESKRAHQCGRAEGVQYVKQRIAYWQKQHYLLDVEIQRALYHLEKAITPVVQDELRAG